MTFDYSKLRGKIKEMFGTESKFADELGISKSMLSLRLNNISCWSQDEIEKASQLLEIDKTEFATYFFNRKVAISITNESED
jgi:hypothetical protein